MSNLFNNPEVNPPEEGPSNAITRLFEETEGSKLDKEPDGAEEQEESWEDVDDEEPPEDEVEEDEQEEEDESEELEDEEAEDSEEDEEDEDELDYEKIKDVEVKIGNKNQKVSDLVNSYQHLQREHTKVTQERSKIQKENQELQNLREPAYNYQEFQEALNQIPELRTKFMQIFTDSQIQKKLQEFSQSRPKPQAPQQTQQTQQTQQPEQTQQEPQPDPELEQKAQEAIEQFKEIHGDNYDMERIIQTATQINAQVSYEGLKQALAVAYADELLEKASAPKTKTDSSKKKKRLKPKRPAKPPAPEEPEMDEGDEILALAKKRQMGPFS